MSKIALLPLTLAFSACVAWAGTFELSDPATQFFEETEEQPELEAEEEPAYSEELRCTVDTGTGACTCVDKADDLMVEMQAGECEALVRAVLDRKLAR